ncbi:MAG: hypothetical protein SFU86_25735 [Pirellulaceae bacterium]|nr:hypothetical protein [Pirellulaceae bacterium]
MPPLVTTRHFQCARCGAITQLLIRVPQWVCPRCGHATRAHCWESESTAEAIGPPAVNEAEDLSAAAGEPD